MILIPKKLISVMVRRKFRFLSAFCILALALANTTCKKETEPKCDKVIVEGEVLGGIIKSPQWIIKEIDRQDKEFKEQEEGWRERKSFNADVYLIPFEGKDYIMVYILVNYKNCIGSTFGEQFFSCLGVRIPMSDKRESMYFKLLREHMNHRSILLWRTRIIYD